MGTMYGFGLPGDEEGLFGPMQPREPQQYMEPGLRPYEETRRDRWARALLGGFRPDSGWGGLVRGTMGGTGLGQQNIGLVDVAPIVNIPIAVDESQRDFDDNNFLGGLLNATAVIPGANIAAAGAKAATKGLNRQLRKVSAEQAAAPREIPGAPLGVNTPQAEAVRRQAYKERVQEGVAGRAWYDDSGDAISFHVGGAADQANRLGGAHAVTSASTSVAANSGFAVKAHNQANAGQPINSGRYPVDMSRRMEEIYRGGERSEANKIAPFEDQLAIGGGYYGRGSSGQGHRAVHDIWDGEAWGYVNPDGTPFRGTFNQGQHNWMDNQMSRVLDDLNRSRAGGFTDWTPGRAQAASWTGAQLRAGRIQPGEEAFSYAQAFPRSYAQGSRETVPGSNTGHGASRVEGRPGLLDAPDEIKRAYDDEVAKIIYDEAGRDRIALGMGRYGGMSGPHFQAPGVYEGVNPGRQTQIPLGKSGGVSMAPGDPTQWRPNLPVEEGSIVPVRNIKTGAWEDKVAPKGDRTDPASRAFMDAVEATYGMGTGQKAAAWSRELTGPATLRNAASFDLGRTLTDDQARGLLKIPGIDMDKIAVVPTPGGMRVMNLNHTPEDFDVVLRQIQQATGVKPAGAMTDGSYFENAWNKKGGQVGQEFLAKVTKPELEGGSAAANAAAADAFKTGYDSLAPSMFGKLKTLDDQFFRDHGFYISPMLQEMRVAVANDGHAGIEKLVRKLGLSTAAIAPLIGAAATLGLYETQGGDRAAVQGLL